MNKIVKISILCLFSIFIIGCQEKDTPSNTTKDKKLKSISYTYWASYSSSSLQSVEFLGGGNCNMTNASYKQIYKNCKYTFKASDQTVKVTFDWYVIPYGKTEEEFQQRKTASGWITDGEKLELWWDGGGGTLYYQE